MMLITRTESHIEFETADRQTRAIDVDQLTGAMLVAERQPDGSISQALMLLASGVTEQIRIEGNPFELLEVHQYVIETMLRDAPVVSKMPEPPVAAVQVQRGNAARELTT